MQASYGADMKLADNVVPIESNMSRAFLLQTLLYEVICQERFDGMTMSETVGVLEFLKWNIINQADA